MQSPLTQVSSPLQTLLSWQSALLVQQPGMNVCVHCPETLSQASAVQRAPSSQVLGGPGWQPSSGSQVSVPLHGFPSSQSSGVPDVQVLLTQVSWPLHTLPSSQSALE